ncbi:MAG: DUF2194 domain-containing protein [Lachnospiraceae bacterium]|nr:DUF2194 domain-containing protein [Lachnospiraceae bacterium]
MRKKKKKGQLSGGGHINLTGLYILGAVYCLLMVVLITVQANVRYAIRDDRLELKPREELAALKAEAVKSHALTPTTLLITEGTDPTSTKARKLFVPVLEQMKEPFRECNVYELKPEEIDKYDKIVLAITHYPDLADSIADIKNWVRKGGNLMIAYPPEVSGSFQSLYEVLGIKDSGDTTLVEGLRFRDDFMIGGTSKDFPIIDAYDCALGLSLADDCEVYMESTDKYPVPLVFRRNVGEGSVVVDNFGILEKAYRGIHCSAYSLLGDYCIYPVINGEAFYIDDFPSPVPGGDATYVTRDYNMSISDFYSQVWWNDVSELAGKHGIYYTGLIIEDYNNQVSGDFMRNREVGRFQYFGNMLLRMGGEIGIHGYNHMPLVLENFDYKDQYDSYIQWPSVDDMRAALDEVFDFGHTLFMDEDLQVYVPPSNVLSEEGRQLISSMPVTSVAAVYLSSDMAYEQEFEVSPEDGIVNVPRITSGCVIDEYMELAAMSELNMHMVNTHFIHPDDVLDEDRGARLGWRKLYANLAGYFDWIYGICPGIRNMTGTELAGAVWRYDLIGVHRNMTDESLLLELDNFNDECYMFLRMNDNRKVLRVRGGSYEKMLNGFYLVKCDDRAVNVELYE